MTVENILSVDLEEWFHICGVDDYLPESSWPQLESRIRLNTMKILEVLDQRNMHATFFVLGFVADRHPALIKEIQRAGHEIACHGYAHGRVYTLSPDLFRRDLTRAVNAIAQITGTPVAGYRAPEWSIRDDSLWALDILHQEGLEYDSSMAPLPVIGNPRYPKTPYLHRLAKGRLWEFPPLVAANGLLTLPLGGGWGLRIFPYTLIRSTIKKLNQQGHPAVIFLHPREFDLDNPHVRLPLTKKLVVDARVERTPKRLGRLLDDFSFTSISTVLKRLKKETRTRGPARGVPPQGAG
jgi:polysaccharide deacetylase family protein (PEP-CTERM system associated)